MIPLSRRALFNYASAIKLALSNIETDLTTIAKCKVLENTKVQNAINIFVINNNDKETRPINILVYRNKMLEPCV